MGAGIAAGILSGLNTLGQNRQAQQQQQIEAQKLAQAKLQSQLFNQVIGSPQWKALNPMQQFQFLQDPSAYQQQQDFSAMGGQLDQLANDPSLQPREKAAFKAMAAWAKQGKDPKMILELYKPLLSQDAFAKAMGTASGTMAGAFAGLNMMPGMAGSAPPPPGPGAVRGTQGGKTGYSYKGMFYTDDELKNATTTGP